MLVHFLKQCFPYAVIDQTSIWRIRRLHLFSLSVLMLRCYSMINKQMMLLIVVLESVSQDVTQGKSLSCRVNISSNSPLMGFHTRVIARKARNLKTRSHRTRVVASRQTRVEACQSDPLCRVYTSSTSCA